MKKSKLKRLLSLFLVVVMLASGSAYTVFAADEEIPQTTTAPAETASEDLYSDWAYWDIYMAQSVYNLGNEDTYSDFQENCTWEKFEPVIVNLGEKFGISAVYQHPDINVATTRKTVILWLYDIIRRTLKIDGEIKGDTVDYFVSNGLMNGRADGDYQLEELCTVEEMIVFTVRTYEYIARELGLDSKGFFWKVSGEKNNVYLLGSIHISDSSLYPLSKPITDAFAESKYLAVEANVNNITEEDIEYIISKQIISDGKTIKDFISEETYELYAAACEGLGMTQEQYDYIKPWAAWQSLSAYLITASDGGEDAGEALSATLGIDMHFLMKSLVDYKNIVEIESVKFQIDLFDSFSPELQEMLLWSLLMPHEATDGDDETALPPEESEEQANIMREAVLYMLDMVKKGDEINMTALIETEKGAETDDELLKEYLDKIWTERDKVMAETIEGFLMDEEAEGDYFVVVGAGHLLGKTGVVQVLIDKGYTVERIK